MNRREGANQPQAWGLGKAASFAVQPLCHEDSAQPDACAINQFSFMPTLQVTVPLQVTPEALGTAHLAKPCHSLSAVLVAAGPTGSKRAPAYHVQPGKCGSTFRLNHPFHLVHGVSEDKLYGVACRLRKHLAQVI